MTAPSPAQSNDIGDRGDIESLVRAFYRDAATDDLLGPVFEAAHVDWPAHVAALTDFWAWQLFGERGYDGNPLRAHEPVHAVCPFTDAHFDRWLDLFTATVDAHFAGPAADAAKQRAAKMARALARLLEGEHGPAHDPTVPFRPTRAATTTCRRNTA
jgi:hemoglobin